MKHNLNEVYLAGGFHSGWQDIVISRIKTDQVKFWDPRNHGLTTPSEYTRWDLNAIKSSTIVFAFFEAKNPGGYALSLELGYAKALEKKIILIDEISASFPDRSGYLQMLHEIADYTPADLDAGVDQLLCLINE